MAVSYYVSGYFCLRTVFMLHNTHILQVAREFGDYSIKFVGSVNFLLKLEKESCIE